MMWCWWWRWCPTPPSGFVDDNEEEKCWWRHWYWIRCGRAWLQGQRQWWKRKCYQRWQNNVTLKQRMTSCSRACDLSSGGGRGGQHDSLPRESQHSPEHHDDSHGAHTCVYTYVCKPYILLWTYLRWRKGRRIGRCGMWVYTKSKMPNPPAGKMCISKINSNQHQHDQRQQ